MLESGGEDCQREAAGAGWQIQRRPHNGHAQAGEWRGEDSDRRGLQEAAQLLELDAEGLSGQAVHSGPARADAGVGTEHIHGCCGRL